MLAGRDAERRAIAALLDAARAGAGGALLVRGVAGSGKSTLLADAVATAVGPATAVPAAVAGSTPGAPGMRVLRSSGVESESPLAFAALQRMLRPLRHRIGVLPAPQRAALRAALGEAEGGGDRFLTFLGTLSLLADASEGARTPLRRRRRAQLGVVRRGARRVAAGTPRMDRRPRPIV